MRAKKHYLLPVAAGFMVLYLLTMTAATCLVHNKYMRTFELQYDYKRNTLEYSLLQVNDYIDKSASSIEQQGQQNKWIMTFLNTLYSDPYQKFSAAYYNDTTKMLYTSQEKYSMYVGENDDTFITESLNTYLSEEEILKLASAVGDELSIAGQEPCDGFTSNQFYATMYGDMHKFYGFLSLNTVWEEGEFSDIMNPFTGESPVWTAMDDNERIIRYIPKKMSTTWIWKNPAYSKINSDDVKYIPLSFDFPYMNMSYEDWMDWHNSTYLQEAVSNLDIDKMIEMWDASFTDGAWKNEFTVQYSNIKKVYSSDDLIFLASECHPWQATFDYLKDVYLICLVLMAACMAVVLYILNRTDKKRAIMEENRRNFVNALAHEMKTPLGIIRGFAENLQEDTVSEKGNIIWNRWENKQMNCIIL